MAKLEQLTKDSSVVGIAAEGPVTIIDAKWHGDVLEAVYRDIAGKLSSELLYRDREPGLKIVSEGTAWDLDADGALLRLVSEAYRIRLAYLFDPMMAVHSSRVDPLPHQITAVYGEMLKRQPLRFLLADDPGAGKTIMAGLLIKELLIRGDLRRCLIVAPGNLASQWQDEMGQRFHLHFDIITRESVESSRTGNPFMERNLVVARLDHLSRNEEMLECLKAAGDWDLVVCDEAHKMSATFFGGEVKYTKRYRLGQLLGTICRHFLLMTATPHNGKEEDFQLFMALLDGDRFEGRFRDGVHVADCSDLMRRAIKESLVKMDGTRLFPERRAYTAKYTLSDAEAALYEKVTSYVREEFNRADALDSEKRKGTVGFALLSIQRRLASSPEAIYQSLRRRKERLESRLKEEELLRRGGECVLSAKDEGPDLDVDDIDDLDDAPDAEVEEVEEKIVDSATAARTIAELRAEIEILKGLESDAQAVLRSGKDRKWEELSSLLQDNAEMFDSSGHRRKLVIFTEHKDTLNYLVKRIGSLLGDPAAVIFIYGGMGRVDRRKREYSFTQDKDIQVLVATDAAGEGINLQRAHLMVNYDIPWNPNRIEQRFGRIHRIGQTEVCHLWNLVAFETREGDVLARLCAKIEQESEALKGQVFDVLGKAFSDKSLRELLMEAVRYGDRPEIKARLHQVIDNALDHSKLQELIESDALAQDSMDASKVRMIREDMERAEAARLQPHFIQTFFIEAFKNLGGTLREREPRRFEITKVPAAVVGRDRLIGTREPVLPRYERTTFEKSLVSGPPLAEFVTPGHPLLDATVDIIVERHRGLLKRGATLVDRSDPGEEPRALIYLEHSIQDGRKDVNGERRIISRRLQFAEVSADGRIRNAGPAPYLDYEPASPEEREMLRDIVGGLDFGRDFEAKALTFGVTDLAARHMAEVRDRREALVRKTMAAVRERLTKEVSYWDHRSEDIRAQESAGNTPKLNSAKARQRADDLQARMDRRMKELDAELRISSMPPVVVGGALVIPLGLLARLAGKRDSDPSLFAKERERVELAAMSAVAAAERRLGFEPRDVSERNFGWDVESSIPGTGKLRFIEVKGRAEGADSVTVTRNEIMAALNKPDDFILAIVIVPRSPDFKEGDPWRISDNRDQFGDPAVTRVHYVRRPFQKEPDFAATSVNYNLAELLSRGELQG